MAYYSSKGKSNVDLIDQLSDKGIVKSQRVKAAMKKVDRADFSPSDPYDDSPQRIGYGATISAPHMQLIIFVHKLCFCVICYILIDYNKNKLQRSCFGRIKGTFKGRMFCIGCRIRKWIFSRLYGIYGR